MIVIVMSGDLEKLLKKESDILINEAIDVGINTVEPKIKGFLTGWLIRIDVEVTMNIVKTPTQPKLDLN